ncbi:MAG: 50S ribosomal protein L6, partial [Candidatus Bathyarchaeia archaeon]
MEEIEVEERVISIPENVSIAVKDNLVEVSGPLGKLSEDFSHTPVKIELRNNKEIAVYAYWPKTKEIAIVGTVASLIKNLIKGVTKGFTYKLKVVYSHFPVTIKVNEKEK